MAIQLIDIATPQVGLKGGAEKLNANFTDTENAASRLVQSSPTDATAGKLMAVGAFGLGAANSPDQTGLDVNTISVLGWNYVINPVNGPSVGTTKFFTFPSTVGGGRGSQFAYPVNTDEIWYRTQKSSATWSTWQPVYTGANFIQAQNTSGATINGGATTDGSNLTPAQTGTWRASTTVTNTSWTTWMKQ